MTTDVIIKQMREQDIEKLTDIFSRWHKPREKYQTYFAEQQAGKHNVLVAQCGESIVGYTTLVWQSDYELFRQQDIPEIVDLNVMTEYQKRGIGTHLIRATEQCAREHFKKVIGISVGQSPDYIAANRLYPRLGYVPDGNSITPQNNELHLTKRL